MDNASNQIKISTADISDRDVKRLFIFYWITYIIIMPVLWSWMVPNLTFVIPTFLIILFPPIFISMILLRKKHGNDIYIIWLIFFLVTCLGLAAYYYLDFYNFIDGRYFDPFKMRKFENGGLLEASIYWLIALSTDIEGEIIFVLSIFGIVTIPQFLCLVICGLFGCARRPNFVAAVSDFAILSFVKFLCALAGLEMSAYIFRSYMHMGFKSPDPTNISNHIFAATGALSLCFIITLIYYNSIAFYRFFVIEYPSNLLNRLWRHSTRYTSR